MPRSNRRSQSSLNHLLSDLLGYSRFSVKNLNGSAIWYKGGVWVPLVVPPWVPLAAGSATRWREIGGFMPIKKPRGLRGLVLLAKGWSGDSGLLARAAAHRHHGEGESAEEETVG